MILVLPSQYEDALAAGFHLRILGIALIFICLMILTNSILQVYGREKLPILTVVIGGITKIVLGRTNRKASRFLRSKALVDSSRGWWAISTSM